MSSVGLDRTDAKIRALEAKLNAMKSESPIIPLPGGQRSSLQPAPSSAGLPLRPKQTYRPPTLEQAVLERAEIVNRPSLFHITGLS